MMLCLGWVAGLAGCVAGDLDGLVGRQGLVDGVTDLNWSLDDSDFISSGVSAQPASCPRLNGLCFDGDMVESTLDSRVRSLRSGDSALLPGDHSSSSSFHYCILSSRVLGTLGSMLGLMISTLLLFSLSVNEAESLVRVGVGFGILIHGMGT